VATTEIELRTQEKLPTTKTKELAWIGY